MISYHKNNILLPHFDNATINLLKSSVLVSMSGAFRVYLASVLLGARVSMLTCVAGFLVIYSVYTLDRTIDSKEDLINREELTGLSKQTGLTAVIVTFLLGSIVFAENGILVYAFLPFITGFLYTKGIKIGKYSLRLKGGLGVKNLVVGFTWALFIIGVAGYNNTLSALSVFIFYGIKVFNNSIIDDFKDIVGDKQAGIKTLPVYLGEKKTRNIMLGLHLISHVFLFIMLFYRVISFEPIILIISFIFGLVCIHNKNILTVFKDGESIITFILKIASARLLA